MPYVRRNALGQIDSLHRHPDGADEFLPDDHPEVRGFVSAGDPAAAPAAPQEHFAALDADFVRVIEDVIDTLILRNVINITDLPAEAQTKLFSRKSFRDRVNRHALTLFGAADLDEMVRADNRGVRTRGTS